MSNINHLDGDQLPAYTGTGVPWARCECGKPIFRHHAWSHEGGTPPQDHTANPVEAIEDEGTPLCMCGLPMTLNPHPEAGKPGRVLDVGALYVCTPCLVDNRHRWATRAWADEREIERLRNALESVERNDKTVYEYQTTIRLCGSMFGLGVWRHRDFESSHLIRGDSAGVYGRQFLAGHPADSHDFARFRKVARLSAVAAIAIWSRT